MSAPRIVSLLPSASEIVCALGFSECLVGRSHECDFPDAVRSLPPCTEPKVDPKASSAEIHRQVTSLLENALSIYRVDSERLRVLNPDVILTQAQCEVCAVTLADVEKAVADWTGATPRIISLTPKRMVDVWSDIRSVADALGVSERGRELVKQLKTRVVDVIEKAVQAKRRPSVACIEWMDPLMAAGNWVPELVELAGGQNLFGEPGQHSPWLAWQKLREADPEVLVVMPCGFDLARTRSELNALTSGPGWRKFRAVQSARVYLADGNQYFNRPGPRLVESLEILAEILHPALFTFGHKNRGWRVADGLQASGD
jgi:iron complex transport system substrate-binding protein